jgi:peptidase M1-like protein
MSRWSMLLLACAGLLAPSARAADAPPDTLASILDAASQLSFAEQGVAVKDTTVKIGHLEVAFGQGVAVPIRGKGGIPLGFYFEGNGGWGYTADDSADRATLTTNIERTAKTLRLSGTRVNDTFQRLLVLFTQPTWNEVWEAAAGAGGTPIPGNGAKSASEMLTGASSSYPEFDFRLAQARLNGTGRWVYVEAAGGLERVGYVFDDVRDGFERLFNFRKVVDFKVRFTQTLSMQRIPGWDAARQEWLLLKRADVSVETPDNKRGTIVSTLGVHVKGSGLRVIPLDLANSLDPDSASWNSPKNSLDVGRVVDDMDHELQFAHKYGELLVEIARTTAKESDLEFRVESAGDVFLDIQGRHNDSYFILQQNGWLPEPASWRGSRYTYNIKVRTKKPWRPVISGRETLLMNDGDAVVAESKSEHPSHILAVLGGKYVTKGETIDGRSIRVHAYAMARKNVIENMPKLAGVLVKFYSSLLGPMPAEELDIVEVPEYGFGISPSGVVLITTEAYEPHHDDLANYLVRGINARLAHEIAHQWFGHKEMDADPSEQWLSESFAEYFSGLAMGALAGDDKAIYGFPQMLAEWRADAKICSDAAPIATANYLGGERGFPERRCLLYARGPLVLHMLRTMIGNDRFAAATKKYLDKADMGPATTADFARAVSETVGTDMSWFFEQWVRGTGIPQVGVEQHLDRGQDGQYRLWGTMRQAGGPSFKKLIVPLVVDLGGRTEVHPVFVEHPETKFEFVLAEHPKSVKVDPFGNNIATYK